MATGFILQPTYRVRDARPVIQLFGRLDPDVSGSGSGSGDTGEAFLIEEDRFRPYFFVPQDEEKWIPKADEIFVERTSLRAFDGRLVSRVSAGSPGAVPSLRDRIAAAGGTALEADVRFAYRFLSDHGIRAGVEIEGESHQLQPGLRLFHNPTLRAAESRPELRVLSIDLETSPDASRIFSVALVGDGIDEVHLVCDHEVEGAVVHADEVRLLVAAGERIREVDPDVLVGWNVVDFDLRTWVARCAALKVSCELGRVPGEVAFQQDPGFTRQARAILPGRMVIDGISLVRDAVRLEDYRLETAARALLGRGKKIDTEAPDAAAEIQRLYCEDPVALVEYNREDARLVLDILEQEGLLALTVERSLLSGMQLDRVGASIASFDLIYLPELRRRGFVAPSVDRERKTAMVKGGALLDPEPGLFSHVAVFDFKSLYPSLIRTFNLDPLAHAQPGDDPIRAPNGACFSRETGILPEVVERFMKRREEARRRGDRHANQAIKIMMNALFGVLGAASCRFFDPEIANAITGFGQQTLHWTRDAFEREGVHVLYGDTDSVFVQLGADDDPEKLRQRVEQRVGERIREAYDVEPKLELELERVFDRLLLPRIRGGKGGSKKRYAGRVGEKLEIVGLESVRRDWPAVAGRLQRGMLERLFADRDVLPFVREIVSQLRAGELDAELVYAKRIRKGSVDSYTATTPPHVQAARKAREQGTPVGPVIRYVVTRTGPEPVFHGRPLPGPIDHVHYLERVLRPVADAILTHIERSFDEALDQPRQMSLL